jgi:hypothetical protein
MFTCFGNEMELPFTIAELRTLHDVLVQDPLVSPRSFLQLYTCNMLVMHLQIREIEENWRSETSVAAIYSVIEAIDSIDHRLSNWPKSLPRKWKCMTVALPPESIDVYSKTASIYSSFTVANDWGCYRALRIFTHSLHLRAYHLLAKFVHGNPNSTLVSLGKLASDLDSTYDKIREVADEVCIAMPYHLGCRKPGSNEIYYPCEGFPAGKNPRLVSACHIVWPLYMAGIVEGVGSVQRRWIARRLDFMGNEMSAMQAKALALAVLDRAVVDDIAPINS